MPLMTPNMLSNLHHQVRNLYSNMLLTNPLIVSDDEFISMFVNPEHVDVLKQTESLVGPIGTKQMTARYTFEAEQIVHGFIHVGFHQKPPIIIPDYAGHGLTPEAPVELHDRVYEWAKWVYEINCKFGDITDALSWLNVNTESWDAVRTMLPILPVLLKNTDTDPDSVVQKRAARLQARPNVRGLPRLPREVKERLIDCCNTALAATLIANDALSGVSNAHFRIRFTGTKRQNLMFEDREGTTL